MKNLCFIVVLLTSYIATAQDWQWLYPLQHDNFFNNIRFVNNNVGFIAGGDGEILKTSDAGNTWRKIPTNVTKNIKDICFADEKNGIAVGDNGLIISTSNGGETWIELKYPDNTDFLSVCYSAPHKIWITGHEGTLLSSYNNGYSWTRNKVGSYNYDKLEKVFFVNENLGFIVGSYSDNDYNTIPVILKTSNGGLNWKLCSGVGSEHLKSVFFITALIGIAVGDNGQILKTTDGGETWEKKISNETGNLTSVYFYDTNNGYATTSSYSTTLITSDGGNSWSYKNTGGKDFSSLYFLSTSNGFAVGGSGIFKTTDAGANWIPLFSDQYIPASKILFTDNENGYALGHKGYILKTTNGGKNWADIKIGTQNTGFRTMYFQNSNSGLLIDNNDIIYQTNDAGKNWLKQGSLPKNKSINAFHFFDTNSMTLCTNNGSIFKTINKGKDWTEKTFDLDENFYDICFTGRDTGYVVGRLGIFIKTYDGEQTWLPAPLDSRMPVHGVFFIDGLHGYTIVDDKIQKTTDGAVSWTNFEIESETSLQLNDVFFSDKNTGYVVGQKGLILKTEDAGIHWKIQNSGTRHDLITICSYNGPGKVCIIADNGSILIPK
ncbi:MAG TPA: YCF48-related protein [Bacteroidales bacterium]|nr:YCF48-related protein [Bacteroidales bacterium]